MFNNEKQVVNVLTYNGQTDTYGQKRQDTPTTRQVEMYIKQYSASNTTDIRYTDIEMIGLTQDRTLSTANQIVYDGTTYNIKYVIPSGRLQQVLLKKVN